jgi:hypothetical protein
VYCEVDRGMMQSSWAMQATTLSTASRVWTSDSTDQTIVISSLSFFIPSVLRGRATTINDFHG